MGEQKTCYKIMVVEGCEKQRVVLKHILETQGWQVNCSCDAQETLDILTRSPKHQLPDLVLIDCDLPGIQGYELCRRLKTGGDTRGIFILLMVREKDAEGGKTGLTRGADDCVSKGIHDDMLVEKIKLMLRQPGDQRLMLGIGSSLFKSCRILVVDREKKYLNFLAGALGENDFHIETAVGGKEAMEKLNRQLPGHHYDCILVDPEITDPGNPAQPVEIWRHILQKRNSCQDTGPMVCLLVTIGQGSEQITRALEVGADDFVHKTNPLFTIKSRIMALLRRKFIQDDNYWFFEELKRKEMEIQRSRIEKKSAEARALLAEKLLETVEQLEDEIDERKRMERQIKNYSRQLERSNKELEAFAYVASHDLKEPLRAISSYLQLVEKRYNEKLDDKGKNFINRAVSGAQRMQDMINDLLTYSRITTRQGIFDYHATEDILERALVNLSASVERRGAIIRRDRMPEIYCDESQMLRLFQNLISNAVKFCGDRRPNIHLSAEKYPNEGRWLFSVQDNGIGIDRNDQRDIFKIFNRLHGRDKYPGTGIGLAICRKIVERHGGKIWVESEPGQGSKFFFTLGAPPENDGEPGGTAGTHNPDQ